MNIENTILTKNGLKTISSITKNDDIKFFYDSDLPNYDYWQMTGNLQYIDPFVYKMNNIDFFERDVIRVKVNDGNPYNCWVFQLFEKFENGNTIYFSSFNNTPTEVLIFEKIKIDNINKQPKHIHFYFEESGYISYSEQNVLVKVNTYYRAN
jgi:hypothetical protein